MCGISVAVTPESKSSSSSAAPRPSPVSPPAAPPPDRASLAVSLFTNSEPCPAQGSMQKWYARRLVPTVNPLQRSASFTEVSPTRRSFVITSTGVSHVNASTTSSCSVCASSFQS
eukprot:Selendium_serpulae@DN3634_c0_g1_i1.p2